MVLGSNLFLIDGVFGSEEKLEREK